MICVSDTPDVEEIVGGKDGLLEGLTPGTLLIDHSTISPSATRRLADLVAERGAAWLDAPVSGGPEGAAQGTLSIMVGGDLADVERAFPYLERIRLQGDPRRAGRVRSDGQAGQPDPGGGESARLV